MRVVYHSVFADEELQSGVPFKFIPGNGTLSVITESGDPSMEIFYNGEKLDKEAKNLPAGDGTELIIRSEKERSMFVA